MFEVIEGNTAMNPEIKGLWVEALRSGKYEQGTGALHRIVDGKAAYCCLGVLCEIAREQVVGLPVAIRPVSKNYPDMGYEVTYDDESLELPEVVQHWSGVDYSTGVFYELPDEDGHSATVSLVELNDSEGLTFDEIADYIEQYF